QSVVDLSKMQTVDVALDSFGATLISHRNDQAVLIQNTRDNVQSYAYPDNKDLYQYADLIRTGTSPADLKQAAVNLQTALKGTSGAIIQSSHGPSQAGSNGLAIYVPHPLNYLAS